MLTPVWFINKDRNIFKSNNLNKQHCMNLHANNPQICKTFRKNHLKLLKYLFEFLKLKHTWFSYDLFIFIFGGNCPLFPSKRASISKDLCS